MLKQSEKFEDKFKTNLVTNSLLELGDDISDEAKGKGRKFVSRFIEAGVAHYRDFGDVLITKETLDKFINTMVGCPVIITHKDIDDNNADKERVGVVSEVWYNSADGWYYCSGIIWDKKAIDLVKNQGWSVSCTYDFESDNQAKTHNGKKIDREFTNGEFLHLALVDNPRYERANIVMNGKDEVNQKVDNGWITTDRINEDGERIKIWIPENVHWVHPKERARVYEICKNYKQGDETKYDFSHTRVKPTQEQIKYLKDAIKDINNNYNYKGIAQIEISSSLNSGSWGVCFAPDNTSLISLAPSMYKENAQKRYDESVKSGFHPKGTGEAIKSVLVHEIGHAITCNSNNNEFWNKIAKIKMDYMKNITKEDIKNKDFISNYARTNKYEFVAEAFCQGTLSKKYGKYTGQVMEAIKEHFGKNVQTKLALNEKDSETSVDDMWIEEYGYGYPIDEEEYEKFQKEIENQETEQKQAKNSIETERKENITMTALNDLENFVRGIVENACKKEVENEKDDKRKLIDEVAGMMKSAGADDELIRTAIAKMEKIAYEKSEADTADNNCKNEKEEAKEEMKEEKEADKAEPLEEKEEEKDEKEDEFKKEKEIVKNSSDENDTSAIDKTKEIVYNSNSTVKSSYVTRDERLKLGDNY